MTSEPKRTGRAARATDPESVERRKRLEAWQKDQSNRSVAEIIRYRDLRGYSNEELRRRLAAVGWDLTKDSLASILAAKRKSMPAADLVLFALALNLPPIALMFPVWTNDASPRWPDDEEPLDGHMAALWASGREGDVPTAPGLAESALLDDFYDVADVIKLRQDVIVAVHFVKLHNMVYTLEPSEENASALTSEIEELFGEWSSLHRRYRGMKSPQLEPGFAFLNERALNVPPFPLADIYSPGEEDHLRDLATVSLAHRRKSAGDAAP